MAEQEIGKGGEGRCVEKCVCVQETQRRQVGRHKEKVRKRRRGWREEEIACRRQEEMKASRL